MDTVLGVCVRPRRPQGPGSSSCPTVGGSPSTREELQRHDGTGEMPDLRRDLPERQTRRFRAIGATADRSGGRPTSATHTFERGSSRLRT